MFNPKTIGAISGLVIGIIFIHFGALKGFIVLLFILIGWLIGKYWMGEIDLAALHERFMNSRGKRPRR